MNLWYNKIVNDHPIPISLTLLSRWTLFLQNHMLQISDLPKMIEKQISKFQYIGKIPCYIGASRCAKTKNLIFGIWWCPANPNECSFTMSQNGVYVSKQRVAVSLRLQYLRITSRCSIVNLIFIYFLAIPISAAIPSNIHFKHQELVYLVQ